MRKFKVGDMVRIKHVWNDAAKTSKYLDSGDKLPAFIITWVNPYNPPRPGTWKYVARSIDKQYNFSLLGDEIIGRKSSLPKWL